MIRLQDHFRAALIALMVLCLVISPVSLAEHFVAGWDGTYIIAITVLAAVVAYYSKRIVLERNLDEREQRIVRGIELAAIYAVLQVCNDVIDGQPLMSGWFPRLDWKTAEIFVPILLVWSIAVNVSSLFHELELPLFEGPQAGTPVARQLAARFFGGGIFLFVCASLTQQRVGEFMHLPNHTSSGPVLNVLLYFLLGMALLGHVQYATLRQRWQHHDIVIATGLGSRWSRYSLGFVALVALLAFILPTSHTANLLDPGRQVWDGVWGLMQGPVRWLLTVLGKTNVKPANIHLPTLTPLPHHPPSRPSHHATTGGSTGNWLDLTKVIFFWALILAVLIYLIRTWSRHRPKLGGRFRRLGTLLSALGRVWSAFRRLLRGAREGLADYMPRVRPMRANPLTPATGLRRFLRVGSMTPRQQVQQYYLSTVRRARRKGLGRRGSQTPYEFDAVLAPRLAEAEGDMHRLTEAFVEARYSRHEPDEGEVSLVRGNWRRVRDALRHVKAGSSA